MSYLEEWHRQQKAQKELERANKLGSTRALHGFQNKASMNVMNAFDRKQRELKERDRRNKTKTKEILNSYQAGDLTEHLVSPKSPLMRKKFNNMNINMNASAAAGLNFVPDTDEEESRMIHSSTTVAGKTRKSIELTFLFGLIYDEEALEPDMGDCQVAANAIVPDILSRSMQECGIRCDPSKKPLVSGLPDYDDWFDKEGSERYVVRGKVMVTLLVEAKKKKKKGGGGGDDDDDDDQGDDNDNDNDNDNDEATIREAAAPLQKLLKRHVSFRPISEADAQKEKNKDLLVGKEGGMRWIRVRESKLGGLGITF